MITRTPTSKASSAPQSRPSNFWAEWDPNGFAPEILRKDTRIYWEPQTSGTVGRCVGTFYGENPGGGQSIQGSSFAGYSPISSGGRPADPTLRLILQTWQAAYVGSKRKHPAGDDYIEVLNLYYFRNPKSGDAIAAWRRLGGTSIYNPGISSSSKFVLLGWGTRMNATPQAAAAVTSIPGTTKVIIPIANAKGGTVTVASGPLIHPLPNYPRSPSGILSQGLAKPYTAAISAAI